jgi:hypothetical protein
MVVRGRTDQIFGDNSNKSKFDSGGNSKKIEFGLCLLSLSPEPSVFPSVVKKSKNENIRDYNFVFGFVWVRNLVSDTRGGT